MMEKEIDGKTYVLVSKEDWEKILEIFERLDRICERFC